MQNEFNPYFFSQPITVSGLGIIVIISKLDIACRVAVEACFCLLTRPFVLEFMDLATFKR